MDPVGEIKRPAALMGPETDERVFRRTRVTASVRACARVTLGARGVNVDVCVGHIVRLRRSHHNFTRRGPARTQTCPFIWLLFEAWSGGVK